jgi:hypothetical protein
MNTEIGSLHGSTNIQKIIVVYTYFITMPNLNYLIHIASLYKLTFYTFICRNYLFIFIIAIKLLLYDIYNYY